MKINTHLEQGHPVISVQGSIDSFTYSIFAKEVNVLLRTGISQLEVNFQECPNVNVQVIKLLSRVRRQLKQKSGGLVVKNLKELESELFELMNKDEAK